MPSRIPSISERGDRLGNKSTSNSRQPSTLNTSRRTYGVGVARSANSSTTTEQHLARGPALLRKPDIVDEGIRRRSLLPQPRSVRQDLLTEQTETGGSTKPVKPGLGWTQPEEKLHKAAEEPASRLGVPQMPFSSTAQKAVQSIANKPMASNSSAPVTAVRRSQFLRKPTTFDGVRKPELRGHSRNASDIVQPNNYKAPVSHRRQVSQMPSSASSLPRASSGSTRNSRPTSAASTSGSVSDISTRSKTKAANNRVAGVLCLTTSEEPSTANKHTALTDQISLDQEQSQNQRSSSETMTEKSMSSRARRPAFTTLQQHYTPKKTAKAPALSMIAASPTKISNVNAMSSDMIRLQAELLELHLLHRTSAEIQRQWEHSAESTLRSKFEDVAAGYSKLRLKESKVQEQIDVQALREWSTGHQSPSFAEKVTLLSRTLQDLGNIDSAGGKFAHVITAFERWLVTSKGAKELGQRMDSSDADGIEFLESLGEGWRADVAALEMRLASRALHLKRLDQPFKGSLFAYLVEICTILVAQMSEELKTMREIECGVLGREAAWVRRAVDCMDPEDKCEPEDASR